MAKAVFAAGNNYPDWREKFKEKIAPNLRGQCR